MPSITQTLDRIAHEAEQIKAHAKRSERPTGPITSAVLYLPNPYRPNASILSLIREATPAERRPFDVYSADDHPGASGSGSGQRREGDPRTYQRLEPHQLTPLRNLRAQKGTHQELEATLHAAEEVINMLADGFHPIRRARKQVSDYISQHEQNASRIAELQARLDTLSSSSQPETKAAAEEDVTPGLSIDKAIEEEEKAIRALEASIAPLRRSAAAKAEATRSPPPKASSSRVVNSPITASKSSASNTPRKPAPPPSPPKFAQATPKRVIAEPPPNSRFTPLHLFTPRAAPRPSSLAPPGSTIVDRMRASITPAQASAYRNRTLPSSVRPPTADPTPVRPSPVHERQRTVTPLQAEISSGESTPLAKAGPRTVEGVEVELPYVVDATATIHKTLGTLLQMCVAPGEAVESTPEATVAHLIKVSRAEPESPSSPGTVSSASTVATPAPPVTRDAIVTAHICLILLRNARSAGNDPGVQYPDMLAKLKAIDAARGWNNPDNVIAKWVPKVQGSRTVTRNWAKKGQVSFA